MTDRDPVDGALDRVSYGDRLQRLLDLSGLSRPELCERAGIDSGRLGRYLRGERAPVAVPALRLLAVLVRACPAGKRARARRIAAPELWED